MSNIFSFSLFNQNDLDPVNNVRLAVGNGLGADIWTEVCDRFAINRIVELYGATEANFGLMNTDNTVGSVGRWPPLLQVSDSNITC